MLGFLLERLVNPVGTENDGVAVGDFLLLVYENHPAVTQVAHDMAVVHNLVSYVDRGAEEFQCALDDLNGAFDVSAKAAGVSE